MRDEAYRNARSALFGWLVRQSDSKEHYEMRTEITDAPESVVPRLKFTQKFFALLALQRLPNLYQGTVSYATQQKRRRQNKAARASRRINRGR